MYSSTILDSAVVKFNTVLPFEKGMEHRYNATQINFRDKFTSVSEEIQPKGEGDLPNIYKWVYGTHALGRRGGGE